MLVKRQAIASRIASKVGTSSADHGQRRSSSRYESRENGDHRYFHIGIIHNFIHSWKHAPGPKRGMRDSNYT